jgi:hypothetical protein
MFKRPAAAAGELRSLLRFRQYFFIIPFFSGNVKDYRAGVRETQVVILNAKEHEAPRMGRFGSIAFIFLYHGRPGKSRKEG